MKGLYFSVKKSVHVRILGILLLSVGISVWAKQSPENNYGAVIETDSTALKNGILEKVVIYPQRELGSAKRIIRKGFLARYDNAQATILVCHGFKCEKDDVNIMRRVFPRPRFNVMAFDFRAHGENPEGQYCTFGRDEALDVIAAVKFLKSHPEVYDKPIIAYGFSMGAASAIEAQAKDPSLFEAMILDCPFDSSENVLRRGLENIKFTLFGYEFSLPCKSLLERYAFHPYIQSLVKTILRSVVHIDSQNIPVHICRFSPAESIAKVNIPCFFIHCKSDEKFSVDSIKLIFKKANGPKQLWLTQGRRHFDSYFFNPEKYTQRIRTFLNQVVNGEFKKGPLKEIIEDDDVGMYTVQRSEA